MKHISILISVLFFTFLSFSQSKYLSFQNGIQNFKEDTSEPIRIIKNQKSQGIEINYQFSGAIISEKNVKNTSYSFINISKFAKMSQVGAPALPVNTDIIAIPKGSVPKITVISKDFYEYSGYMIHPALKPATGVAGEQEPEFEIDSVLYHTDAFFPENISKIRNIQYSRGTPLVYISINPVQFNPVTGTIRVYTNIKYRIDFEGGTKSFEDIALSNSKHYIEMLKSNVLNYSSIPESKVKKSTAAKSDEKEYIILTHSEYIDAANDLADWKRQLGYSVEVVSQSSWTTAQIKAAVADRYNAWTPKPDYFVIIGDHTGSYALPGEIHNPPSASDDFATDLYYACMDGAGDYTPDMAHGRISVRSAAEAQIVVDKIINYEKNPTTDVSYYTTATHCAMFQESSTKGYAERRFAQTAEECLVYMNGTMGYNVNRVYKTDNSVSPTNWNNGYYSAGEAIPSYLLKSNGFAWDGDKNDIKAEIDAGRFYLLHRDHGYTGGVGWADPEYLTSDISSLANGDMLPVIFSMNCHTGEYQLDNCFAEEFIRVQNKGAVGVIAAAYYSISGYNDALAIGMFDAIWPGFEPNFTGTGHTGTPPYPNYPEIFTMGDVLNQGLLRMTQSWGDAWGYEQYEYELFHWFGDPAMKIWTSNPHSNTITADHPASVDCAGTTFAITNSEPGATATLVFNNELIGEVVLDGSGNGTINYTILNPGATVVLTVSNTNCVPYSVDLPLSGSCNFPPAVHTNSATTVTVNSANLNGDITDDFGSAVTESGFVYSTSTDPLIGGLGVTQIQTSPTVTSGIFNEGISGLSSQTTYYYKAYAINANGTSYGDEEVFTTLCGIFTLPFTEDFSGGTLPQCWENIDNQGSGEIWQFNNPGGRTISTSSNANGFAILDSDNYGNGNSQNADLITPTLDLSGFTGVNLYFEHYFREWSGSSATLSYSIDGGSTWAQIQQWTASTANAATFNQAIPAVNGQSNVKFKWNYTGSYGYYWAIDDINITGTPTVTSISWNGSINNNWQTAGNWDGGAIPTSTDNVIIPNVTNQPIINNGIANIAQCNDMTIDAGADITIDSDGYLTVNGSITNNAGTSGLVINSDATGTGSLIQNTSGGTDATVKCYLASSTRQWHMVSSPVSAAALTVFPSSNNLYYYDESTDDYWNGTTYGSSSVTGWTAPSGNMTVAKGYAFNYYATTLNYTGLLNDNTSTSAISVPYTNHGVNDPDGNSYGNSDGWNLIGNPYTSAIDWDNPAVAHAAAHLDDAVYTYDDTNMHNYTSYVNEGGVGTNGGTQYIPAMQGFFVKGDNTETSGTLNIGANARVHNAKGFWKSNYTTPNNFLRLKIITTNEYTDETVIRMLPDATVDPDNGKDAYKLFTWADFVPQIYTKTTGSTDYSINTIKTLETGFVSIPLKALQTGDNYKIEITEFNFNGINVFLKDNLKNETVEIGLNDIFELTSDVSDNDNRFELVFEKSTNGVLLAENTSVMLFPNPTNGLFYLIVGNRDQYTVKISNITGQTVFKNSFFGNTSKTLDISNQSSGIYFVNIKFKDNSSITKKIVIE